MRILKRISVGAILASSLLLGSSRLARAGETGAPIGLSIGAIAERVFHMMRILGSEHYWKTGTRIGSEYYWKTGTRLGSEYYWKNGTRPGSEYYWKTGTKEASEYYWKNGTRPSSEYYWKTGTSLGSEYYWKTGTGPGSEYYWKSGTRPGSGQDAVALNKNVIKLRFAGKKAGRIDDRAASLSKKGLHFARATRGLRW